MAAFRGFVLRQARVTDPCRIVRHSDHRRLHVAHPNQYATRQNAGVTHSNRETNLEWRVRVLLAGFMLGLVVSGVTAFPLPQEVSLLSHWMGAGRNSRPEQFEGLLRWIVTVRDGLQDTDLKYPFLFYGTDWLAFGHLVIALVFVGPYKDPVRNVWVIRWGMIACALVIPLALICGSIRGIPPYWRLIDCSFGLVGIVPLIVCDRAIRELEGIRNAQS